MDLPEANRVNLHKNSVVVIGIWNDSSWIPYDRNYLDLVLKLGLVK
jgi:hypothetical protein